MTTTISSSSYGAQRLSPRDMLQNTLATQVASGKINASDQDALSAALDSIDSSMQAARGSFSSTRAAPPSPDEAKSKIESLINDQVSSGSLTSDQADELKQLFSDTFANGPGGGRGAHGGPPPGPPPGEGQGGDSDSGTTSFTITTNDSGVSQALQDFLKQLQDKIGSGYSSSGQSSTASTATSSKQSSLLFDISA